ncbi:MAG: hydroxyacylglutathione hydrolase [Pseudomonadota bacterium]
MATARHPIYLNLNNEVKLSGIPILKDNWIWVIHTYGSAWAVDPGESTALLHWCSQHPESPLTGILITHKHHDHIDGIPELLASFPQLNIWAPAYHSWVFSHQPVRHHQTFTLCLAPLNTSNTLHSNGNSLLPIKIEVIHTPGHTLEHVSYCLPEVEVVFCGDTLFSLGCGRMFEGNPTQYWHSLATLRQLPEHFKVACTHEYTLSNAYFAAAVSNYCKTSDYALKIKALIAHYEQLSIQGESSLPSTLGFEQQFNPFLRCDDPEIKYAAENYSQQTLLTAEEVFAVLRTWKNGF